MGRRSTGKRTTMLSLALGAALALGGFGTATATGDNLPPVQTVIVDGHEEGRIFINESLNITDSQNADAPLEVGSGGSLAIIPGGGQVLGRSFTHLYDNATITGVWLVVGSDPTALGSESGLATNDLDIEENGGGKALFTSGVYINGNEDDGVSAKVLRLTSAQNVAGLGADTLATRDFELVNGFAAFGDQILMDDAQGQVSAPSLLIADFPADREQMPAFLKNGQLTATSLQHSAGHGSFEAITVSGQASQLPSGQAIRFSAKNLTVSGSPTLGNPGGGDILVTKTLTITAHKPAHTETGIGDNWVAVNGQVRLEEGGTITVAGLAGGRAELGGEDYSQLSPAGPNYTGVFTMTGGQLNVGDGAGAGDVWFKSTTVSGGTVTIKGFGTNGWDGYADFGATSYDNNTGVRVTGGTINLEDYGILSMEEGRPGNQAAPAMELTGGTINLNGTAGKESFIEARADFTAEKANAANTYTGLHLGGATVNLGAGKAGALFSRATTMDRGQLKVDGLLLLAGTAGDTGSTIYDAIDTAKNPTMKQWGDFYHKGGTIAIGQAGLMDLASGNVTFHAQGGAFTGKLALADSVGTASGTLYARQAVVDQGQTLTVAGLDLSRAKAGALQLQGALVVNGAAAFGADTAAGAVALTNTGELTAQFSDFLNSDFTAKANVAQALAAAAGSTLYLQGLDAYTAADRAKAASQFANLTVDFLNAEQTGNVAEDITADEGGATVTVPESTSDSNTDLTVNGFTSDEVAVEGKLTSNTLTVNSSDETVIKSVAVNEVTLTGSGTGTQLIHQEGSTAAPPAIIVNSSESQSGTLNLGIAGKKDQGGSVGEVQIAGDQASLNVRDGEYQAGAIAVAGKEAQVTVTGQGGAATTLTAGAISVAGEGAKIAVTGQSGAATTLKATDVVFSNTGGQLAVAGGTVEATKIGGSDADKVVTITVGNAETAGHIVADTVEHAKIILDPAFVDGASSTTMTLKSLSDTTLAVLRNSWFLLDNGQNTAWMAEQIPDGKLTANGYTAALGIRTAMKLDAGQYLLVDGSQTEAGLTDLSGDTAKFADKSLLLVDAGSLGNNVALTPAETTASVTIADGATLKIIGAKDKQTITILNGFASVTGEKGWGLGAAAGALLFDGLLKGTAEKTETGYQVTTETLAAGQKYGNMNSGLANLLDQMQVGGLLGEDQMDSDKAGIRFIAQLVNSTELKAEEVAKVLEGAAQMAVAGGAQGLAAGLSGQISDLGLQRLSLVQDVRPAAATPAAGEGQGGNFAVWARPFYQHHKVSGLASGAFQSGYESDLAGAAIGLDRRLGEQARLGLALSVGGGDAESNGDWLRTENDIDFWGLNLYGGARFGGFNLMGDVGFTQSANDIEQRLPLADMNLFKASPDSQVFTAGLNGEYVYALSALDIIPHLGVRYSRLSTDAYDATSDGAAVFQVDKQTQNIVTVPLGVAFAKDIATEGGWNIRPRLDVGVILAAGDTETDSVVHVPGAGLATTLTSEMMDKTTFNGGLGLQAQSGGFTLGLDYNIQASENRTSHSVYGLIRYDF